MRQDLSKTMIIMAEDDEDDRMMMQDACLEAGISIPIQCVENGEELMVLLQHHTLPTKENISLNPVFILLDLNMPKLDGRKTLELIKKDTNLKKIPIIIFTTSDAEEDVNWAYANGASSFITKPSSFESLVDIMKVVQKYWIDIVSLPK